MRIRVLLCFGLLCCWTGLVQAAVPATAPTNLQVTTTAPFVTSLSRDPVPTATSYVVSAQATGIPTRLARTSGTAMTLRGLPVGIPLTVTVSGRNAEGPGPGATTSFTATPAGVSSQPTGLTLQNVGTSVGIRWTSVPNAVS